MESRAKVAEAGKAPGRAVRVALILSLTVNLLFAGVMAGAMLRHGRAAMAMREDTGLGPLVMALDRKERLALRADMLRGGVGRPVAAADFDQIVRALRSDPWDEAAMQAALDRLGGRSKARLDQGRDALLAQIAAMTPAERGALAGRLEESLARAGK